MIYRTEREKFAAIADEIERLNRWTTVETQERRRAHRQRSAAKTTRRSTLQLPESEADGTDPARQDQADPARRAGRCSSAPSRSKRASGSRSLLEQARHQARGAQRQASQARGRDRRPGRPQGRGHHRHEHGRPRYRHHPRRQSRDDGLGPAARQIRHAPRRAAGRMGRKLVTEIEQREEHEGRRARRSRSSAACTSSAPSGTKPAASTCSSAAVAVAKAIPAAAASTSRSKTT